MNLKKIFDNGGCANIKKPKVSKNIGKGIAEYYESGRFMDKKESGMINTLKEEKEKEQKKIDKELR